VKVYDAARCPYCARVRIVVAEKGIEPDCMEVDLNNRPDWLRELNPPAGRVPVLDDGFILPESEVIMAYLEELHPTPALLPPGPAERACARLLVHRFDDLLGDDYYAFRRGDENRLAARLEELPVGRSLFSDIAYVPWVLRARDMLGVQLPERLGAWVEELSRRPSVAAEAEIVRSL
jgi:glutathione S-transferase